MFLLFAACVRAPPTEVAAPALPRPTLVARDTLPHGLSDAVAAELLRYPTDGTHGYHWPPDDGVWWGTSHDVRYLGVLLSPGDPAQRSHCVGLTWEVGIAVLQAAAGDGPINGLGLDAMTRFREDWFVRELGGIGAAEALAQAGLGGEVPVEEARRGDMLQLWSVGMAGHSAIFDRWVIIGRDAVGLRYWSSHPAIGGIGYRTELFSELGLRPEGVHVGRIAAPGDWVAVAE